MMKQWTKQDQQTGTLKYMKIYGKNVWIEQKGMTFEHDFGYYFQFSHFSLSS